MVNRCGDEENGTSIGYPSKKYLNGLLVFCMTYFRSVMPLMALVMGDGDGGGACGRSLLVVRRDRLRSIVLLLR